MNVHPCTAIKNNFRKTFNERQCFPSMSPSGISQVYSLNLSRLNNATLIPCKKAHIFYPVEKQVVWMCDDLGVAVLVFAE